MKLLKKFTRRGNLKLVLDTGILMLILKGDPRVKDIVTKITQGAKAYTTTINLTEVYYKTEEKLGSEVAVLWFNRLAHSKDLIITPIDLELAMRAGKIKAKYRRLISVVDALIIALAEREKAKLITTDERLMRVREVKVLVYKVE